MKYVRPVYRPPSEAYSLLIQASIGCSRASCTFCASWLFSKNRVKVFSIRPIDEIEADLVEARSIYGDDVKKIFFLTSVVRPLQFLAGNDHLPDERFLQELPGQLWRCVLSTPHSDVSMSLLRNQ